MLTGCLWLAADVRMCLTHLKPQTINPERACCELLTFHPNNVHLTQTHSSCPTHCHTHSIMFVQLNSTVIMVFRESDEKKINKETYIYLIWCAQSWWAAVRGSLWGRDPIKAVLPSQTRALITSANAQKRHMFMFKWQSGVVAKNYDSCPLGAKKGSRVTLLLSHKVHRGMRLGWMNGSINCWTLPWETAVTSSFLPTVKFVFLLTMTMVFS